MAVIRAEVQAALRAKKVAGRLEHVEFQRFRERNLVATGREFMSLVHGPRSGALGEVWSRATANYPFYTSFVESALFHGFHAATRMNERIDRNAQPDYEQLCYLLWADIFVSNDTRFLASAFETLWRPRGKRLMTSETFVAMIGSL